MKWIEVMARYGSELLGKHLQHLPFKLTMENASVCIDVYVWLYVCM